MLNYRFWSVAYVKLIYLHIQSKFRKILFYMNTYIGVIQFKQIRYTCECILLLIKYIYHELKKKEVKWNVLKKNVILATLADLVMAIKYNCENIYEWKTHGNPYIHFTTVRYKCICVIDYTAGFFSSFSKFVISKNIYTKKLINYNKNFDAF